MNAVHTSFVLQYRREASAKKQSKAMGAGAGSAAKKGDPGDMDEAEADGDHGVAGDGEPEEGMGDDADGADREREPGDDGQQHPGSNSLGASAMASAHIDANNGGSMSAEVTKMDVDRRQSEGIPQGGHGAGIPMEGDGTHPGGMGAVPVALATAGMMAGQENAVGDTTAG